MNWLAGESRDLPHAPSLSPVPCSSLLVLEHRAYYSEPKLIEFCSPYLVLSFLVVRLRRGHNEPRRMYLDGPERVSGEHLGRHHHRYHSSCLATPRCLRRLLAEPSHSDFKTFKLISHLRLFTSHNPLFPLRPAPLEPTADPPRSLLLPDRPGLDGSICLLLSTPLHTRYISSSSCKSS